ncbi:MAG: hypothetical protein ACERKV_04685 [Clostridiaceae bacterium]
MSNEENISEEVEVEESVDTINNEEVVEEVEEILDETLVEEVKKDKLSFADFFLSNFIDVLVSGVIALVIFALTGLILKALGYIIVNKQEMYSYILIIAIILCPAIISAIKGWTLGQKLLNIKLTR